MDRAMRRLIVQMLSVLLGILSHCGPSLAADVFKYPKDDLVVSVDFLAVAQLMQQFEGSSFAFKYVDNGMLCASPYVSVDINESKINWNTRINLFTGSYNTTFSPKIVTHLEVSHCTLGTFRTDILCSANVQFNSLGGDLLVPITCRFDNGNIFDIIFSKTFTTHIPALLPSRVPIQLIDPPPAGHLKVSFEFTEFKNGGWSPLPAPLDRKRDWPLDVTAMLGGWYYIETPQHGTYDLLGSRLFLGGTITHPRMWKPQMLLFGRCWGLRHLHSRISLVPWCTFVSGKRLLRRLLFRDLRIHGTAYSAVSSL